MGFARARLDTAADEDLAGAEVRLRSTERTVPGGCESGNAFEAVAAALARALGFASGPRVRTTEDEEATRELLAALWAVDLGGAIRTLSTHSLWVAIANGTVSRRARVWREGMECWSPIEDVPDLACALVDSPDPSLVDESHARSPEPPRAEPGPPRSAARRPPVRSVRGAVAWVAGGSAFAASIIGLAVATTAPTDPPAALRAPAPWAAVVARSAEARVAAPAGAVAPSAPLGSDPRARRHVDPGQHRARAHRP